MRSDAYGPSTLSKRTLQDDPEEVAKRPLSCRKNEFERLLKSRGGVIFTLEGTWELPTD